MPKRRRFGKWGRWLFGGIFLLGIVLLFLPTAYHAYLDYQNQAKLVSYEKTQKPTHQQLDLARQFNANMYAQQLGKPRPYKTKLQDVLKQPTAVMGFITIPAINLKPTTIRYGDTDAILAKGTGIMPGTALPVGGKNTLSVVSGHSGLANRIIFDNIRYLKPGDVFYITALGQPQIAYEVYAKKVIDPTDKRTLKDVYVQPGKDRAVLLTCTPLFVNSHRLLVYGKRVPIKQARETPTKARDTFSLEHIWLMVVASLLALFALALLWRRLRHRRPDSTVTSHAKHRRSRHGKTSR